MFLEDDESADRRIKALVYGPTGSGKTDLGVSAPDPVILLCEPQGWEVIRDAARRRGRAKAPPTFLIKSIKDMRHALGTLMKFDEPLPKLIEYFEPDAERRARAIAQLPYLRPRTVVADSVTEFVTMIAEEVFEQAGKPEGTDGLPAFSVRMQGIVRDRGKLFGKYIRDLPYSSLLLARSVDRDVGEGARRERKVAPDVQPFNLGADLAGQCNLVGFISKQLRARQGQDAEIIHQVRFAGPSWMMMKTWRPLRDVEPPDFGLWHYVLSTGERPAGDVEITGVEDEVGVPHRTGVASAAPQADTTETTEAKNTKRAVKREKV